MLEEQLEPLFQGIISTIKNNESTITSKINEHEAIISEKNKQIQLLNEINEKHKSEMEEFLKVSFASRWKRKSDEIQGKYNRLEEKYKKLTETNSKLNHHIDKKTELEHKETQTEVQTKKISMEDIIQKIPEIPIEIETKKGVKYILKNNILSTIDGKVMGNAVVNV
tara:strand:- start:704 stop:1204 length:501 start_codon:yes stop_codon:yes gene_type:complete